MKHCGFDGEPEHLAEYTLADKDRLLAIEHPTCEKHLTDMIIWRFVNGAEGVLVTKLNV